MVQNQLGGRFTTLGDGVPLKMDGEIVGAIGVSGGTVQQDIKVAEVSVMRFNFR